MEKNKFLLVIIVALLLLNAGTLGFLFYNSHKLPPPPPPQPTGPIQHPSISGRLKEPLKLTDAQAKIIDSMQAAHFVVMDSLGKNFGNAVATYFMLLTKENYTQQQKDSLQNLMVQINNAKANAVFANFENIKKTLNANQQKEYEKMLPDILRNVIDRTQGRPAGRPGRSGGPGGPDGPPPPPDGEGPGGPQPHGE